MSIWSQLKTRSVDGIEGLITIVVQDEDDGDVLMLAYANQEAVEKTVSTGLAHYYSTSRRKLWLKGESSGNTQKVSEVLVDCDGDAIIYKVAQKGGACHTGYRSCFYRRVKGDALEVLGAPLFNPEEVYKKKG
jgi:phosphoribosyl-AMP cyclohydrolase